MVLTSGPRSPFWLPQSPTQFPSSFFKATFPPLKEEEEVHKPSQAKPNQARSRNACSSYTSLFQIMFWYFWANNFFWGLLSCHRASSLVMGFACVCMCVLMVARLKLLVTPFFNNNDDVPCPCRYLLHTYRFRVLGWVAGATTMRLSPACTHTHINK